MGLSHPRSRGTPSQVWTRGYPIPGLDRRGTISKIRIGGTHGYPISRMEYLPTIQTWDKGYHGYPPGQDWMGYPIQTWDRGTHPSKTGLGTPHPDLGWGVLRVSPVQDWMGYRPPPPISKASTCYAAGDVPLAFTHEDFLVLLFLQLFALFQVIVV